MGFRINLRASGEGYGLGERRGEHRQAVVAQHDAVAVSTTKGESAATMVVSVPVSAVLALAHAESRVVYA